MAQNENIANRKTRDHQENGETKATNTKFCQLPTTAALKKSQWACFHADNRVVLNIPAHFAAIEMDISRSPVIAGIYLFDMPVNSKQAW
ncbi:hypothetical protein GB937_007391 [Aspergillus fischeri]|nr:hypothetical protein GB937_007391 [Aspergillus fischeri]